MPTYQHDMMHCSQKECKKKKTAIDTGLARILSIVAFSMQVSIILKSLL